MIRNSRNKEEIGSDPFSLKIAKIGSDPFSVNLSSPRDAWPNPVFDPFKGYIYEYDRKII
jgi:hypothetical protein